jgi:hypothetical protein
MDMRQYLPKVPHVEIGTADRAIAEMIGLGFRDAVRIDAKIFTEVRHRSGASFRRPQ